MTEEEKRIRHNIASNKWYHANKKKALESITNWYNNLSPERRQLFDKRKASYVNEYNKRHREEKNAYHKEWRNTPEGKIKFKLAQKRYIEKRKQND